LSKVFVYADIELPVPDYVSLAMPDPIKSENIIQTADGTLHIHESSIPKSKNLNIKWGALSNKDVSNIIEIFVNNRTAEMTYYNEHEKKFVTILVNYKSHTAIPYPRYDEDMERQTVYSLTVAITTT
jgi:hypothetical protein